MSPSVALPTIAKSGQGPDVLIFGGTFPAHDYLIHAKTEGPDSAGFNLYTHGYAGGEQLVDYSHNVSFEQKVHLDGHHEFVVFMFGSGTWDVYITPVWSGSGKRSNTETSPFEGPGDALWRFTYGPQQVVSLSSRRGRRWFTRGHFFQLGDLNPVREHTFRANLEGSHRWLVRSSTGVWQLSMPPAWS